MYYRRPGFTEGLLEDIGKIGVLRSNGLGDYIFSLPALDSLRSTYPSAEIVLLGGRLHAELLRDRPGPVDRVITLPYIRGVHLPPGCEERPSETESFIDGLADERFDLLIQMYGGGKYSNPFISRIPGRFRIGMKAHDAGRHKLDAWIPYYLYHPEILRYIELVSLAGVKVFTTRPRIEVVPGDLGEASAACRSLHRPFVVLHPGASDSRRMWPVGKFALLAGRLHKMGLSVAVTGSSDEAHLADAIAVNADVPVENLCGRLTISGLVGTIYAAGLVVSNDTGPLHLARAIGTPAVGIYWVGNMVNAAPATIRENRSCISWRIHCPECGEDCTKHDCPHRTSFVADVTVDEVAESALSLLEEYMEK
jgi:ADP-heptose:LPS heptosyltransferase